MIKNGLLPGKPTNVIHWKHFLSSRRSTPEHHGRRHQSDNDQCELVAAAERKFQWSDNLLQNLFRGGRIAGQWGGSYSVELDEYRAGWAEAVDCLQDLAVGGHLGGRWPQIQATLGQDSRRRYVFNLSIISV